MAFEVDQELLIDGTSYRVAVHPAVPGFPFGQEGRQGVVYKLTAPAGPRAIKVFKAVHRRPALVSYSEKLAAFAAMPGLSVCRRTVLTPQSNAGLLQADPDLMYAVLMPWIDGPTWMELLLERRELTPEVCLSTARAVTDLLARMEQAGLAHCDLSGANLLIPALCGTRDPAPSSPVALVDVEQLFGPGLDRPDFLPGGSSGYAHRTSADGLWSANADRFAGAILLGEILGWCDPQVREASWGEAYFDLHAQPAGVPGQQAADADRYRILLSVLESRWGGPVAGLFERAWRSESLAECATFGEWLLALPERPRAALAPPPGVRLLAEEGLKREQAGDQAGALEAYLQALDEAPAGSGLAEELRLIVAELKAELQSKVQHQAAPPPAPPAPVPAETAFAASAAPAVQVVPAAPAILLPPRGDGMSPANIGRVALLHSLVGRPAGVTAVAWSPTGNLAVGSMAGDLWLGPAPGWQAPAVLPGHSGPVTALAFSPDGRHLASGGRDGMLRLRDAAGGAEPAALRGHTGRISVLTFSPDSELLISASLDGTLRFWSTADGAGLRTLQAHTGGVMAMSLSPDGSLLATGGCDGARLWRLAGLTALAGFRGQAPCVRSVAFSQDGQLVATGAADGCIRLWEAASGTAVAALRGHAAQVEALAFTPDGALLASGSADRTVRMWNPRRIEASQVLRGCTGGICGAAFSPDGRLLAAAAYEGVRIWGLR